MADYADLVFEVKNVNKTVKDIVKVRKEIEKTGKETKSLQETLVSGWSFGKVFQSLQKFGDAFRDVQVTLKSFSEIYGDFNKRADAGVKMLINDFQETERSAKKLLNLIGSRTINLGLDSEELTKMNVELARITEEISAATGQRLEEVGKKLSQSLAGEVGGLKDLGIVINSSGQSFKDAVSKLQRTGVTEEAAKAMVIFGEIQKQTRKFDGSFKEGAKSITQSFGNIENTLKSGVFAKAGETLSDILKPTLDAVDSLLANDYVKHIGGIVTALGTLTVSVLLLKKTLVGFNEFIGLTGLLSKGGGLIAKIAPGLTKALAGLLPIISSGLAALATALVAALPYVLVGAITAGLTYALVKTVQLIKQKGFGGAVKAIGEWFTGLWESILNWLKGKGFNTNLGVKQIEAEREAREFAEKLDALKNETRLNLDKITSTYNDFIAEFVKIKPLGLKDGKPTAAEIQKKLNEQHDLLFKNLKEGGDLANAVAKSTNSFNYLTFKYLNAALDIKDKINLYDSIFQIKEKFGKELEDLGVNLNKFNKRVDKDGTILVSDDVINKLFDSEIIERDFLKLRDFIMKKYIERVKDWERVQRTVNKHGTGPLGQSAKLKFPDAKKLLEEIGLENFNLKIFEFLKKTNKEYLNKVYEEYKKDKDYGGLKTLLVKIQKDYKDFYEKFKKGKKIWKLDGLEGMKVNEFKDLVNKDPLARLQIVELLKTLSDQSLKNAEDLKKENEAYIKLREILYNTINDEINYLKEWKKEKWSIIANSISLAFDLKLPGTDNIKERLKSQEEKIKKFKELFNFDKITKEIAIPDKYNASLQYEKKRTVFLKSAEAMARLILLTGEEMKAIDKQVKDEGILAVDKKGIVRDRKAFLIEELKLAKLAKLTEDQKLKLIDEALKTEKKRFEDIEYMWKKQNDPYTEKEKISLLKELQQHYLDKFNIEMEGLEKERQYIEETNNFIQQTLSKVMEWAPQGISAIHKNTMEGYKFMTSGFRDLGNFSAVINQKNSQEVTLQTKTNDLISKTKDVINDISKKIDSLMGDAPTLTLVN